MSAHVSQSFIKVTQGKVATSNVLYGHVHTDLQPEIVYKA